MSLVEKIRTDSMAARKAADKVASSLLVTLLAEADKVGKDAGNRETTDAEAVKVVQKFLKGINQFLEVSKDDVTTAKLLAEKAILEGYLPKMPTLDELKTAIAELTASGVVGQPGPMMGALKKKYPDGFDARAVAEILKNK